MVAIDACIALIIWFPDLPCAVADARDRVDYLLEDLERRNEKILIPAPALAELLVEAGNAGAPFVNEILKSGKFRVSAFDTRAAVEVALQIAQARKRGNKRGKGNKDNWQKVKFDHQIVAIAKTEGVSILYTNDSGLANFAKANDMEVIGVDDLPSPPSRTPLFDQLKEIPVTPVDEAVRKEKLHLPSSTEKI